MKDQFVVACIDSPHTAPAVIQAAKLFADSLRHKGLMLLNVSRHHKADWLKDYGLPFAALQGDWATAIEGLPTAFNAILAVAAVDPSAPRSSLSNPRTLLRAFRNCKTAYLTIPHLSPSTPPTSLPHPSHIPPTTKSALPLDEGEFPKGKGVPHLSPFTFHLSPFTSLTIDYRRESKEKLIWASYLARFLHANLTLALPQYRDSGLRQQQRNNLLYIQKIFKPLNINYTTHPLPPTTSHLSPLTFYLSPFTFNLSPPDLLSLTSLHPDLHIALTTDPREKGLADLLFGTPELQLLRNPSSPPILFLNPRDDLYVLCD